MKTRVMLLAACSAVAMAAWFSGHPGQAQAAPKRIEVTARRFSYDPAEITLKKGQPVALVIKSLDVAHGLRFMELNLNAKIAKGGSAELDFTPDKTGEFVGHCSVFCGAGHGGMILKLHVVE